MAILRKMELGEDILITLKLTKGEYEAINTDIKEFMVLPADGFDRMLTTGRLGNGNRIMIPGKFLKSHHMETLKKNVRSRIVDIGQRKLLIIELESKGTGIPVFEEEGKGTKVLEGQHGK